MAQRIENAAAADDAARADHTVAADLGVIADDGTEFSQAGGQDVRVGPDGDFEAVQPHVGKDHASGQMRLVAEDGVAHIVVMRHLAAVEDDAVLELTRVSEHAAVADDDVLADVAAGAELAVPPDPGRAFDHHARLQRGALINEHILADERAWRHLRANLALQPEFEVGLDPRQRRPHWRVIREQDAMLRVGEIKVVAGGEHFADVSSFRFKVSSVGSCSSWDELETASG